MDITVTETLVYETLTIKIEAKHRGSFYPLSTASIMFENKEEGIIRRLDLNEQELTSLIQLALLLGETRTKLHQVIVRSTTKEKGTETQQVEETGYDAPDPGTTTIDAGS